MNNTIKIISKLLSLSLILILAHPVLSATDKKHITIGSKNFTEQYVLAEIIAQTLEARLDIEVERKLNLGGSSFCYEALKSGGIDIYPEYTGTGLMNLLDQPIETNPKKAYQIVKALFDAQDGLIFGEPFGFNNSWAFAVSKDNPLFSDVHMISDLAKVADQLRIGVVHEFLDRQDGYPDFLKHYQFEGLFTSAQAFTPGLLFPAIANDSVNVIVVNATDGLIGAQNLKLLTDDKQFFPPYEAAPFYRAELNLIPNLPEVMASFRDIISSDEMIELNYKVDALGLTASEAAREFLISKGIITTDEPVLVQAQTVVKPSLIEYFWHEKDQLLHYVLEHLFLVLVSLGFAVLLSVPVGIVLTRYTELSGPVFAVTNILQTIPSMALLGALIPLFGVGLTPALIALFLYALLPIIRNTYTGIKEIDPLLIEATRGLGLTNHQILFKVELPLSLPMVMAGIRTSSVLVVGTATLAAFIGAGGLGDPIFRGISSVDNNKILFGAIPAALLAVMLDRLFNRLEQALTVK